MAPSKSTISFDVNPDSEGIDIVVIENLRAESIRKTVKVFSLITAFVSLTAGLLIYYAVSPTEAILIPAIVECLIFSFILKLSNTGNYKLLSYLYFTAQNAATLYYALVLEPSAGVHTMCLFNAGIAMLLFSDRQRKLAWGIVFLIFSISVVNYSVRFVPAVIQSSDSILNNIIYPIIFFHIVIVFHLYSEANKKLVTKERILGDELFSKTVELEDQKLELETQKTELEKLNQFKNRVLAENSHELRNPIQCISLVSDMMQLLVKGKTSSSALAPLVDDLKFTVAYVKSMINNGLTFSKLEQNLTLSIEFEPRNVRSYLGKIQRIFQYAANEKHLKINLSITDVVSKHILIDHQKFSQVIGNLVENAIKYTTQEKDINIKVDIIRDKIVINIIDQGPGIPAENLNSLFDLYSTNSPTGSGIGLYVAKTLTGLMGGTIGVESTMGKGTTFTVELPYHPTEQVEEETSVYDLMDGTGLRVLVLEDNHAMQLLFSGILSKIMNFTVDVANTASQAISLLEQNRYAVIFSDVSLPDMSIQNILSAILLKNSHDKLVLVSGESLDHVIERFAPDQSYLLDQMDSFLLKPFSLLEINKVLTKMSVPQLPSTK